MPARERDSPVHSLGSGSRHNGRRCHSGRGVRVGCWCWHVRADTCRIQGWLHGRAWRSGLHAVAGWIASLSFLASILQHLDKQGGCCHACVSCRPPPLPQLPAPTPACMLRQLQQHMPSATSRHKPSARPLPRRPLTLQDALACPQHWHRPRRSRLHRATARLLRVSAGWLVGQVLWWPPWFGHVQEGVCALTNASMLCWAEHPT